MNTQPQLTVRLCSFPESNGKRNWTALLVRADSNWDGLIGNCGGITIARGELWNRVAYEAERAKLLIGERDTEPHILDYGDDIQTPEEWAGEVRGGRFLQFQREKTALKYFLIGRGYHVALKALGFVERYNVGLRKDGVTPSLHHEVQIALSVSQVKDVSKEELCIVAALLHDVQEDHQIPSDVIAKEFGQEVADVVWKLTKKFAGNHKNKTEYIDDIAMCEVASIVKGLDRVNNLHSMIGVFTLEKMTSYANEAEKIFLPMLKKAGKLFPEQQSAYHAISQQMKQAILFTRAYVKGLTDRDDIIADLTDLTASPEELPMLYFVGYLILLGVALVFNYSAHTVNKAWDEANGFDYYRD